MTITIVADENIPAVEHYLAPQVIVRRVDGRALVPAQLVGADALLVRSVTRVDAALLAASEVRFIGSATSGVDHVDREYLQRRGIAFTHAPGANANAVVEYVLAAISAVGDTLECLLAGGRVGIVGYGMIGRALAARLQALGVSYRVYDPWLEQRGIPGASDLAGIIDCDVVSLHPELTRAQPWPSYHLLGPQELAALAPDCLLINASRGPVVDNRALCACLAGGSAPQVVLDVWEGEPDINPDLLQLVTLGTPHIAGYSLDGKLLATRMLCEAMATSLGLEPMTTSGPAMAAPLLDVPGTPQIPAQLRALLQGRYDIRADDRRLRRAIPGADHTAAGSGFDRLRRDYPQRRELAGSAVSGDFSDPRSLELLRALGCVPAGAGDKR